LPTLHDLFDALLDDIEIHVNAAYPEIASGSNKIYRGWPNLELSWSDIPTAMLVVADDFPMTPSGNQGERIEAKLMIVVLLPLPTDKTLNITMEGLKEVDKLVTRLKSQFVWGDDWVNSYITNVSVEPAPLEGQECHRITIDFVAEAHVILGS
jgi:hypothetical protein